MATDKTSLGDRMKGYENINRNHLISRMPVILRLDGKAFHTFTKGFDKPYDKIMAKSMESTMRYLCENIQGTSWEKHRRHHHYGQGKDRNPLEQPPN